MKKLLSDQFLWHSLIQYEQTFRKSISEIKSASIYIHYKKEQYVRTPTKKDVKPKTIFLLNSKQGISYHISYTVSVASSITELGTSTTVSLSVLPVLFTTSAKPHALIEHKNTIIKAARKRKKLLYKKLFAVACNKYSFL